MTPGNLLFLLGASLEILALGLGVDSRPIALSGIAYGVVLLATGYLG